jgi:hypothetical protein
MRLPRHHADPQQSPGDGVDGVDAVLTPGQKTDNAQLYGMTEDNSAAAKLPMAHIMFLATETGRPAWEISDHYEDWKARYARAHLDEGTDEGNFWAKVKEVVTKRQNFRQGPLDAGRLQGSPNHGPSSPAAHSKVAR